MRDLTGGGVDHVVEVGGPGTLAQSIAAVRVGGHISLIGVLTGREGEVPTVDLMAKQARLQGLVVGSRRQQQDYVPALEQSGYALSWTAASPSISWPTPSVTRPAASISARSPSNGEA